LSWYLEQEGLGSVVPGTVYELEIEIGHRAHVFSTSHRIGLVVQSSNYPRFDLNPGNGDPFFDGVGVAQNNTIYFGADNASVLVIPYFDPT